MDIRKENELDRQMDLLQMKEISTYRQQKNGTRIFQLPIKKYGQYIEVGSFESGYVRRMNGCYTPYQLNKCEPVDHYYKAYDYNGEVQKWNGKYHKYVGKKRILIPNEVDRLEYLIAFCLKNYYINQANMIEDGKFIPKWKYEYELAKKNDDIDSQHVHRCGDYDKIKELKEKIMKYERTVRELHEEIDTLSDRFTDLSMTHEEEILEKDCHQCVSSLSVIVNNERYKVI